MFHVLSTSYKTCLIETAALEEIFFPVHCHQRSPSHQNRRFYPLLHFASLTSFVQPPPSPHTATLSMMTATTSSVRSAFWNFPHHFHSGNGLVRMCFTTSFWVGSPLSIEKSLRVALPSLIWLTPTCYAVQHKSLRSFEGGDIQTGKGVCLLGNR